MSHRKLVSRHAHKELTLQLILVLLATSTVKSAQIHKHAPSASLVRFYLLVAATWAPVPTLHSLLKKEMFAPLVMIISQAVHSVLGKTNARLVKNHNC